MPRKRQPTYVFAVRQRYEYEQGEHLRIAATFDKAASMVLETSGLVLDPLTYPDGEWYTIRRGLTVSGDNCCRHWPGE